MSTDDLLQRGIAAARAGQREEARTLLVQVVEADERNEQAWLWLAGVVDDPEDMRTCLENVLELNPGNVKAQQGLTWIDSRYGPRVEPQPEPVIPEQAQAAPQQIQSPVIETPVAAAAPATAAATPPVQRSAGAQPGAAGETADHPCPYCGVPMSVTQQSCPKCRNSMMMRDAPRPSRSAAVTMLSVLWGINAVMIFLGAVVVLLVGLVSWQSAQSLARAGRRASTAFPIELLIPAVVLLIIGAITLSIAIALWRRRRWAYYIVLGLAPLVVLGMICNFVSGIQQLSALPALLRAQNLPPEVAGRAENLATTVGGLIMIVSLILNLLYLGAVAFSWRDFFGRKVRFIPSLEATSDLDHYNNGVFYKNRGMWYMAAKEWEAAVKKAPRDLNYLHALGLAYAQIRQFDQARATLDKALTIAPEHAQLRESRSLIDKMAARP